MKREHEPQENDAALRARLELDDARLRSECVVHTHRVGGPGGQHRNKTESAIRLLHRPSGLVVTGEERRSQHQNMSSALQRLREALAVCFRAPLPMPIDWPDSVRLEGGRLRVSDRNAAYFHVLGIALDALHEARGNPRPAAERLAVSTSSFVRFLHDNPRAWQEAQRLRGAFGLTPLQAPGQ